MTLAPGVNAEGFVPGEHMALYGFGDALSKGDSLLSFEEFQGSAPSGSLALAASYRELLPEVTLSGPTNFAPAINFAISEVKRSRGQFVVLVIITDGQVRPLPCLLAVTLSSNPLHVNFLALPSTACYKPRRVSAHGA
jgi:Copine